MADGPKRCDPGYTPVSLHDYLVEVDRRYEARFLELENRFKEGLDSQKDAVQTAMAAAEKAVTKAEASSEKRFESVNEFRAQLNDQVKTFMSRVETEQRMQVLTERLDISLAALSEKVTRLEKMDAGRAGAEKKSEINVGMIFGVAGLVVAIGTMIATAAIIFVKH